MEFWDFLYARYNVCPLNLQSHCDRCGAAFGVTHALSCSTRGLFIARQNEICDELLYLSQRAFTSASVRSEPLIHKGRTRSEQKIHRGRGKDKETREGVMILGLWYRQVEAIIDVKFGDADADS